MLKPWAALFVCTLGCAPKISDIFHEGHHHFAYMSGDVIAWDVHVPPHTATGYHEHKFDYLFVTLGPATITTTAYNGLTNHLALADGEIRYAKAPLIHLARNDGPADFHNVTIELKKPDTNVAPCDSPCVFQSDQWTAYEMTLAPGQSVDTHNAFIVAVSPINLTHRPEKPLIGAPGKIGDSHNPLTNAGSADARFVMLEFGDGRTRSNRLVEQRDSAASTRPGGAFK